MGAELQAKSDGTFETADKGDTADADKKKAEEEAAAKAEADKKAEEEAAAKAKAEADKKAEEEAAAKAKADADKKAEEEAAAAKAAADKKAEEEEAAAKANVEKAGARMAKDRYNRFKQAVDTLQSVLHELSPEPGPGVKGEAKQEREPAQKAADGAIDQLTDRVVTLAKSVERIATARGPGNAQPVEKSSTPAPQKVSWPLDMARPITRDTVKKQNFWD